MNFKLRLFVILLLSGLTGIFSFLLVDLNGLLATFPFPPGTEVPVFTPILKVLSLVQPAILLAGAILIGLFLAPKAGLSSPAAEALAGGGDTIAAFRPQIVPGIIGGLLGGVVIVFIAAVWSPFLPPEVVRIIGEFGKFIPLPTRLLYGGVTEELLLRWGFMTLLVWAGWRLFQKRADKPTPVCFIAAIVISALIFGIGHLPVAFLLVPEPTLALIAFVISANSAFGLIAGYLYWRKGLESAIIAHALTHIVLFTASYAGAYF